MTENLTSLIKSSALIMINKEVKPSQQSGDDSDEERELTNLNWLLRSQNLTWPRSTDLNADENLITSSAEKTNLRRIVSSKQPCNRGEKTVQRSQIFLESKVHRATPNRPTPSERFDIFVNKVKRDLTEYEKMATKYESDDSEKPPFNYSHIIGMAMLKNGRVTLQQICAWIEDKFAFFRGRKKWNNSIRHNLSLHHCFRNRKREEKGKGGYWELGVDPKKCDKKRIRNRKLGHSKLNRSSKCHSNTDQLSHKQPYLSRFGKVDKQSMIAENSLKNSSTCTKIENGESQNKRTDHEKSKVHFEKLTPRIEEENVIKKVECDQVKKSPAEYISAAQSLNCFISHNVDSNNTISGDDFSIFNVNSDLTPVLASTSTAVEDQIITTPIHPCNIIINYDCTNFRPLLDSIDEQYQYLQNDAEYSRNDDTLDNILDVCISRY
ncbi:forkhead box protein J1-B isoform X2 [Drosophila ficusphila]|uniref:forkhead box protein J1-B isoform X2 n=1 Tax=Drosophila ficusphila TaxID=30025 RepID=UPI0007E7B181|nr:forkhead box protein J1-B isoform X2 [Drosophila ficusphila]